VWLPVTGARVAPIYTRRSGPSQRAAKPVSDLQIRRCRRIVGGVDFLHIVRVQETPFS
jgi:hypothetical protein